MSALRRVMDDIKRGKNIDLVASVILAFAVSALDLLGVVSLQIVLGLALPLLGLLAVGLLSVRYRLDDMTVAAGASDLVRLESDSLPSLEGHLRRSREVWMLGLMLRGTLISNLRFFEENAASGLKMRAMILDPERANLKEVATRFIWATPEDLKKDLEVVVNRFRRLSEKAREADNIELRLLPLMPPFCLYIFPTEPEGGIIYVETYGYKSPGSAPRYVVSERVNSRWYAHFKNQFEVLWKDATPVKSRQLH